MPPPKIPAPNFSPFGRYVIDVRVRRTEGIFHDTQGNAEDCGIENIPIGAMTRFDSKEWAIQRGFVPCEHCVEQAI